MPLVPPKNAFGYKPLIIKLKFLPPDVVILIYSVGSIAKHAIYEQSLNKSMRLSLISAPRQAQGETFASSICKYLVETQL